MAGAATTQGLEALRARIAACALPRRARDTLMIATWNIRELGKHPRRPESLVYIAEILSLFDLVSIVELRENLEDFEAVMDHLGPHWDVLMTSPLFDPGRNRERAAYLYNTKKVRHHRLASMAHAPRTKRREEYLAQLGWWREPFLAAFTAADAELLLLTAHLRWGKTVASRASELKLLADWVATDIAKDPYCGKRDVIVLGDFNIPSTKSALLGVVQKRGLVIPEALRGTHGTNLAKKKRYDQILHLPGSASVFTGKGGAVDFYGDAGAEGIRELYPPRTGVDVKRFTFEMSDHLPLWVQIRTKDQI